MNTMNISEVVSSRVIKCCIDYASSNRIDLESVISKHNYIHPFGMIPSKKIKNNMSTSFYCGSN